jgi:hypothetical protein
MEFADDAHERRARIIKDAISRLKILPGQEWRVDVLAYSLAMMTDDIGDDGKAAPPFRQASAEKVAKDLNELARRADGLADKMEKGGGETRARDQLAYLIRSLSGDAVDAISAVPMKPIDGQIVSANILGSRIELPRRLEGGDRIAAGELRFVADLARSARKSEIAARDVGRPPNMHAQAVASVVTTEFKKLTGREQTFSQGAATKDKPKVRGDFLEFANAVFCALGIRHYSAQSYVARTAFALRKRGRKK